MIYFLYGANTYEIDHGLGALLSELTKKYPEASVERFDGADIEPARLPDMLQGTSLFSDRRIIILRSPSANKAVWAALEGYVATVSDATELVIVDAGADKRTKTFKALQNVAQAHEYAEFGPRNVAALQKWVADEAASRKLALPRESVILLIDRVGYDQWALGNALTKLALVEDGSPERIRELTVASQSANAFELFEHAVKGDTATVRAMLVDLQATNDPHALLGLLGSQAYQLALVANSSKTPVELGRLLGSSPYPLQKLSPLSRRLTKAQVRSAVDALAECDRDLKRSAASPWTLLTRALLKIAAH